MADVTSRVIDWNEAMVQVGDDRVFLIEVMQELLNESRSAFDMISTAVAKRDYQTIYKEAHRVKGSASYLFCASLRDYSFDLQNAATAAETDPTSEHHEDIVRLNQKCRAALQDLEEEFKRWCRK